jgi:alpha-galactosidase
LEQVVAVSAEPAVNGEFDARHAQAILPEPAWGWVGTPGLAGSRGGLDHSTFFEVTRTSLTHSGEGDGALQTLSATAHDSVADLDLEVEIQLTGTGLARARATLTSTGDGSSAAAGSAAPYGVEALNIAWPVPRVATALQDYTGRWIRERTVQRTAFTVGARVRDSRRGKPGHDSAFLLTAGTHGFGFRSGEVWSTHVAWSGNSRTLAERTNGGIGVIGGGELLLPGEVLLHPGDSYHSPWVYASYGNPGLDHVSSRFHRWLRSRPQHPRTPRPVIANTWEAVYFSHEDSRLRALADAAAEVGAERFVLDDGWFMHRRADNAGLGDWYVDPSVYPQGLEPLADYVRGKGLEFGLWVEPEMINPDSDLARAHPEWIAQPELAARRQQVGGDARLPLEARQQQVLDLTHPEAYAYIEERLHTLVREIRPSYLKWDHNRDLLEAGNTVTGRPIVHEQTLALYRLLDGLKREYPGLEIESCAGGGGRIDLGVLEHTDRVWASDTNDPLERQRIQLHTSLLVPPELMGTHIGPPQAHTTHRTASLDFRAGTALWGHMGLEWNVAGEDLADPATRTQLKAWIELHKRFRTLLHSGDVVRSDVAEPGRVLQGVVARDHSEALYSFASMDSVAASPVGLVRLEGLEDSTQYSVTRVDPVKFSPGGHRAATPWTVATLSGRALATHGVQVPGMDPQEVVLLHAIAQV